MKAKLPLSREYAEFVTELKQRIVSARLHAARAVNRHVITLYWDIGRGIVEKQRDFGWGDAVVESLSEDLRKAFPNMRGFAARSLWNMRRFYSAYSSPQFLPQLVAEMGSQRSRRLLPQAVAVSSGKQLKATDLAAKEALEFLQQLVAGIPWGQHLLILDKVGGAKARLYYLRATAQFGWTRNVLLNQIKAKAYERSLRDGKTHNFPTVLPEYLAEQAEEALKSSYNLEFLGIRREVKERKLEARLTILMRVQEAVSFLLLVVGILSPTLALREREG